jgi:hypothetical protein
MSGHILSLFISGVILVTFFWGVKNAMLHQKSNPKEPMPHFEKVVQIKADYPAATTSRDKFFRVHRIFHPPTSLRGVNGEPPVCIHLLTTN